MSESPLPSTTTEQLQAKVAEALDPNAHLSLAEISYFVTLAAANYADLKTNPSADQLSHSQIVAATWKAYDSGELVINPITSDTRYSKYGQYTEERLGLKLHTAVDRYMAGCTLVDNQIPASRPEITLANQLNHYLDQVINTPSSHSHANQVRHALVMAKIMAGTASYIRHKLAIFTELGSDPAFMPRHIKEPYKYWQQQLMDPGVVIGFLPALDLLKGYKAIYQRMLANVPLEKPFLNTAIRGLNYLRTDQRFDAHTSARSWRQPLFDALLSLDTAAIVQAYQNIAATEPNILIVDVADIIGLSRAQLEASQTEALHARLTALDKEPSLTLGQLKALNYDLDFAQRVFTPLRGKFFRTLDGLIEIREITLPVNYRTKSPHTYNIVVKNHRPNKPNARRQSSGMLPTKVLACVFNDWQEVPSPNDHPEIP